MSLKRLAIRTKKSLSGLHAFGGEHGSPAPETPKKAQIGVEENIFPGLEDFGGSPASSGTDSPSKSLSKRSRFKNSLRRMRSGFGSPKSESIEEPVVACDQTTPVRPRPSLALNFEVSPPGRPIFASSNNSSQSSGVDVPRSSPIAVPNVGQHDISLEDGPFPSNTVPTSPAPLTKACFRESIGVQTLKDGKTAMPFAPAIDQRSTLSPGSNLTLEDIQTPDIVVSSPSKTSDDKNGYFGFSIRKSETQPQRGNSDFDCSTKPGSEVDKVPTSPWSSIDIGPHDRKRGQKDDIKAAGPENASTHDMDDDPFALDAAARRSLEGKHDFVNAYLALEAEGDDELPLEESTRERVRRSSAWGRHTGLYDGTGYAASDLDESVIQTTADPTSEASKSEESPREKSETTTIAEQSTNPTSLDGSNADDPGDEKETLQEIIRAYAFTPEVADDRSEINERAILEIGGSLSESETNAEVPYGSIKEEIAEDMAVSLRVMNRSLGG